MKAPSGFEPHTAISTIAWRNSSANTTRTISSGLTRTSFRRYRRLRWVSNLLGGAQLDGVAVGIEDPKLAARHVARRLEELDVQLLEGALGFLEIFHIESDMGSHRIDDTLALLGRDQMNLIVADL